MKKYRLDAFIASVQVMRRQASDEQALDAKGVYAEWAEDVEYSIGNRVLYGTDLYACLQSHASQAQWNPEDAPSLWAKVLIPDPGQIPEWEQPSSTNPYMAGDKVRHNSKIWISLVDNNVWEPGAPGTESLWDEVVE